MTLRWFSLYYSLSLYSQSAFQITNNVLIVFYENTNANDPVFSGHEKTNGFPNLGPSITEDCIFFSHTCAQPASTLRACEPHISSIEVVSFRTQNQLRLAYAIYVKSCSPSNKWCSQIRRLAQIVMSRCKAVSFRPYCQQSESALGTFLFRLTDWLIAFYTIIKNNTLYILFL